MEQGMEESDVEGPATHDGPESCAGVREGVGEALTGAVQAGLLSRERTESGVPTSFTYAEGNIAVGVNASRPGTPRGRRTRACTEAPCARTGRAHRRPRPDQERAARGRLRP